MTEFHPYFTLDGSVGLYNEDFDDIYHSATGALTEAYEKFILPVDYTALLKNKSIKVLDICYGIGYNSKSFLNFIFENYFEKKFFSKLNHAENNIAPIYTNNIRHGEGNILSTSNDKIYTDNVFDKIYIKAVDNDEILSYISPFVKTGEKNIKKDNYNFEYKNIEKYLTQKQYKTRPKINSIINYLILDKIAEKHPKIFENNEFWQILTDKKFRQYFDQNLVGIFKHYKNIRGYNNPRKDLLAFLHNIYYSHVSMGYKKGLNSLKLDNFDFTLEIEDARQVILNDKNQYNLIFLDAFTPSKCPCLWSYEFFKELYAHLEKDGMLLTYSTSASIRAAMIEAGFFVGANFNQKNNRCIGTIAAKNSSLIKHQLSKFDLGLLKTTAGIFYRDENLTGQNEHILECRKLELQNSKRISSSHYKKLCQADRKL